MQLWMIEVHFNGESALVGIFASNAAFEIVDIMIEDDLEYTIEVIERALETAKNNFIDRADLSEVDVIRMQPNGQEWMMMLTPVDKSTFKRPVL